MLNYIRKSLLSGVGLALRSKSEIESIAKELADQSKLNQEEAGKLFDELNEKYDDARNKLDERIEKQVEKVFKKFDIAGRSDIDELNKRIDRLVELMDEKKE
ncbi:MAG: phasin family protein [Desulfarculaceae bacterium]|nr:phasin family protein [Desulfarculaceae bacterium]